MLWSMPGHQVLAGELSLPGLRLRIGFVDCTYPKKKHQNGCSRTKDMVFFYSTHSSSLSKPDAYIAHVAIQLLSVQYEIRVCYASRLM